MFNLDDLHSLQTWLFLSQGEYKITSQFKQKASQGCSEPLDRYLKFSRLLTRKRRSMVRPRTDEWSPVHVYRSGKHVGACYYLWWILENWLRIRNLQRHSFKTARPWFEHARWAVFSFIVTVSLILAISTKQTCGYVMIVLFRRQTLARHVS